MYMGEFGHNTDEWQRRMVSVLKEFADNVRFERCKPQTDYIATMGLR